MDNFKYLKYTVLILMLNLYGCYSGVRTGYENCSQLETQILGDINASSFKYQYKDLINKWGKPDKIINDFGYTSAIWYDNGRIVKKDPIGGNSILEIRVRFRENNKRTSGFFSFNKPIKGELKLNYYVSNITCTEK